MLLTTGERVTAALVTMALADQGIEAVSFTGSQVGIITDTVHRKAKILEVKGDRVRDALAAGKVAVVAGFQGVSTDREITTLGRGASDLTASALAKALEADACEIYTDVTGVFSADPRIVPQARKLARINFDEMLEMAGAGSKVLALRSVEFARNHNVPLHVRSSFTWEQGTWVTSEEPSMEDPDHLRRRARRQRVQGHGAAGARPSRHLGRAVRAAGRRQRQRRHDRAEHLRTTAPPTSRSRCRRPTWASPRRSWPRWPPRSAPPASPTTTDIAKVSLVGAGMKTSPGIAAKMFRRLADEGVNIEMISTSTIRISRRRRPGRHGEGGPRPAHRVRPRQRAGLLRPAARAEVTEEPGDSVFADDQAPPASRPLAQCGSGRRGAALRRRHRARDRLGLQQRDRRAADARAEFVATGTEEVGYYCHHLGLHWGEHAVGKTFVEIGSGIGRMTAALTRTYPPVVACDLDAAFLEQLPRHRRPPR